MFYFQTMFQQVYNGITGSAVLPAVQQIAEAILLLAALFAVYEAYAKGGDARTLALAGVRYLIMGLLITPVSERLQQCEQRLRQCCPGDRADGCVDELPRPGSRLYVGEQWPGRLVELGRRRRGRGVQPHLPSNRRPGLSDFVRHLFVLL